MSIEIENINVKNGDTLLLKYNGSCDTSIVIQIGDGDATISTPMNKSYKEYRIDLK